jgi:hypothetical protein
MANGPPFYRLKMSKGTGQGLRAGTVTPIDRVNEAAASDRNGGALGRIDPIIGDLTWGTTGSPAEKTITVPTFATGSIICASVKGEITTDRDAFYLTRYDGRLITWGSGALGEWDFVVDGEFFYASNAGFDSTFSLKPRYVDGAAKSLTLNILEPSGIPVQSIVATAQVTDNSVALAEAQPSLLGVFAPRDLPLGVIDSGNQNLAMEDISNKGAAPFTYPRTGDAAADQWEVVSADVELDVNPIHGRMLKTNRRARLGESRAHSTQTANVRTVIMLLKPGATKATTAFGGLLALNSANTTIIDVNYTGSYGFYTRGYGSTGFFTDTVQTNFEWQTVMAKIDASHNATHLSITTLGGTLGDLAEAALVDVACDATRTSVYIGGGHFDDAQANHDGHLIARLFLFSDSLSDVAIQGILDAL